MYELIKSNQILPKHHQPRAPPPKASGNTFQALVNPQMMETTFPLMEEIEQLMELMKEALLLYYSMSLLQKQQ
jgi:hypothetical protein